MLRVVLLRKTTKRKRNKRGEGEWKSEYEDKNDKEGK